MTARAALRMTARAARVLCLDVRAISSGVVFRLNTIWPTGITTHRFYYYFYEPIV